MVGGGWYIFQSNLILSIILYSNIKFILGIAYFQIKIIIIKNENSFFFSQCEHPPFPGPLPSLSAAVLSFATRPVQRTCHCEIKYKVIFKNFLSPTKQVPIEVS